MFNVPTLLLLLFLSREWQTRMRAQVKYLEMVPIVPRLEVLARLLFMLEGNMAMFS